MKQVDLVSQFLDSNTTKMATKTTARPTKTSNQKTSRKDSWLDREHAYNTYMGRCIYCSKIESQNPKRAFFQATCRLAMGG